MQETPPEPKLKTYKNYLENMLGLIKHLVQEGASSVMFGPVKEGCTPYSQLYFLFLTKMNYLWGPLLEQMYKVVFDPIISYTMNSLNFSKI